MSNLTIRFIYLPVFLFSLSIISCATITVNVYFPAEEVRQAYTNLEEEFLLEDEQTVPESNDTGTAEPGSSIKTIDLISGAFAQENIAGQIEAELKKMPEVVKAFKSRAGRQSQVNALLGSGKAGEGNNGMLVARSQLSGKESSVLKAENTDRKTIITGMAKAILKLNNLENTPQNIKKVYPEAAEQFAATRRDASKSGWSVQLPNGKWAKKR